MNLEIVCCTANPVNVAENVPSWLETLSDERNQHKLLIVGDAHELSGTLINLQQQFRQQYRLSVNVVCGTKVGPVGQLQRGYEHADPRSEILAFIHDDVVIHEEGWEQRVLREFADPTVGVVGFGGATGLGTSDIYRTPYQLVQLARIGYASNVDDAENHGARFERERDVATLDGFCLIVRRSLLEKTGGWPDREFLTFHNYDNSLAVHAARHKMRVRLVGVRCQHKGGGTSTRTPYQDWAKQRYGKPDAELHTDVHAICYEAWRDVLPLRV